MWQSLLVYNACPQPQTEATVLVSPSLLQIDTFGKWCRCLHNVCYLKLKKRRYLDKCRLSAPADSTGGEILAAHRSQLHSGDYCWWGSQFHKFPQRGVTFSYQLLTS